MNLDEIKDFKLLFPVINGKVSAAINRMMYLNFKKNGLDFTPEQWTILAFLWHRDGISQQMLCDSTFKDKPSMTRLLDNLVKQGLVYRDTCTSDRRSNLIYLTEDGRIACSKANKAVQLTMGYALRGIDEEGIRQVKIILSIVFGNIKDGLKEL